MAGVRRNCCQWFSAELSRFGPESSHAPPVRQAARAYCNRLARDHYENFTVVSFLLPRRLVPHFNAVYAWCRWADNLGDEVGDRAPCLLNWWRKELLDCYQGKARHPVTVALSETVRQFAIPPRPFLDLISAFEQDQFVTSYRDFDQLLDYCRRSANPVGRIVLYLCRAFSDRHAELSDHICTALQLTNFWQDVRRDLAIGRVYLPEEDRRGFGVTEDDLKADKATAAFKALIRFEVERTRKLFYSGLPLVGLVPRCVALDVELFGRGGLAILDKIAEADYDVLSRRPVLTKWDKARLTVGALYRRAFHWV